VTVSALAMNGTLRTTVVTFAVFLNAMRFFACAAFGRHEGLDIFEVAWVSVVGHHLGGLDLVLITRLIVATGARALAAAYLTFVETVAIEL
jgi:hypothetical protein